VRNPFCETKVLEEMRLCFILLFFGPLQLLACGSDLALGSTEAIGAENRSSDMSLPRCGFLSARGVIWDKTYSDGARLRVFCRSKRSLNVMPGFVGVFQDPIGRKIIIGKCDFRRGYNKVVVNEIVEHEAVYLVSTYWEATDGKIHNRKGTGSAQPRLQVQSKTWFFEVRTRKVVLSSRTYSVDSPQRSIKSRDIVRLRGELLSETRTECRF
jgi:hypothetical protein